MTRLDAGMELMRQICAVGLEAWRQTFALGEAAGASHTEILRAYIGAHDLVLGVIGDNPQEIYPIKERSELERLIIAADGSDEIDLRTGAVPCRSREEAVAMSRTLGDIKKAH